MATALIAAKTFTADYDGERITISQGESCNADHELVIRHRNQFVTVEQWDDQRRSAIKRAAENPGAHEAGATFHTTTTRTTASNHPNHPRAQALTDALRAIERHDNVLEPQAADRLDTAIRGDRMGLDAAYVAAVADPAYNSAFGKLLAYGAMAPTRFTGAEQEAMQTVTRAEEMRAMVEGTGSAGGYAVPFALDPSIMNSSAGVNDPIRDLARQITITGTNEWRGVSSAGVSSNYGAEASEVNDDSPTLAQPTISAERWTSFVPFSMELGGDWSSLQAELAELMRDAKLTLDATKMLTGTGSDEPGGILNIGGTGGLTTTQRVLTAGTAAFAVADVYALKQALPPRFRANATYVMADATIDVVYRFVAAGSTSEPPLLNADRTSLVGRPVRELSTMATGSTSGAKLAIYGDWKAAYAVVTRLGVQIELLSHLFGASGRPTGQRGLLAIGRTGGGVTNANAARYIEVR